MNIIISKSPKPLKKFVATINGEKDIYFGAAGFKDYTIHQDDERKERYIKRHAKRENWEDPLTSGFWSRWVLWSKKTIEESIDDINKRFPKLHVRLK